MREKKKGAFLRRELTGEELLAIFMEANGSNNCQNRIIYQKPNYPLKK